MLYNVPGRTSCNLLAETTLTLARHPAIVAVKEASGDLAQIQAIIDGAKDLVLQALLVDPVVTKVGAAEDLIEQMIALQPEYLGYLR